MKSSTVSKPTMTALGERTSTTILCRAWFGLISDRGDQPARLACRNLLEQKRLKTKLLCAALLLCSSLSMGRFAYSVDSGTDVLTSAQKVTLQKVADTCAACHGINGRSTSPTFPNLAAQTAPYIELQLHAFKDQTRADPDAQAYMWGMASQLDDASISGLAAYFSKQSGAEGKNGNAMLIAQGKKIFVEGVPGR